MKTILENIQDKIVLSQSEALKKIRTWEKSNAKIVFSNGCFDILHQGHITYLAKAAELGTHLIIGLNSDNSVRRLKGDNRPINPAHSRALLLAALGFVDMVLFFEEDTPYNLIKLVAPNILVKGADYKPEDIVGYDIVTDKGGKVVTIALEEGFSTTNIITALNK